MPPRKYLSYVALIACCITFGRNLAAILVTSVALTAREESDGSEDLVGGQEGVA